MIWALDRLAIDCSLSKKSKFERLYSQYHYFKGQSQEQKSIDKIKEDLKDSN